VAIAIFWDGTLCPANRPTKKNSPATIVTVIHFTIDSLHDFDANRVRRIHHSALAATSLRATSVRNLATHAAYVFGEIVDFPNLKGKPVVDDLVLHGYAVAHQSGIFSSKCFRTSFTPNDLLAFKPESPSASCVKLASGTSCT
jgi:hypothetical protein